MQVIYSQSSQHEQSLRPLTRMSPLQSNIIEKNSIPVSQNMIMQPIKYIQHFPVFKKRRYKAIKFLDVKVSLSVKFQKMKRVMKNVKYISKLRLECTSQKNSSSLYTIFSRKAMALEIDKLANLPRPEKEMIIRRLREFRYVMNLNIGEVRSENDKYKKRELHNFQYSIQALRNLESISFCGDNNTSFFSEGMCRIFPLLHNIKKIEGPIDALVLKDFEKFKIDVQKLANIQEFKFDISESTLNPEVLESLKSWMETLAFARKLVLFITNSEFRVDLTILNEIEVLEIVFQLSDNLSVLAQNVHRIENIILPVSFEWKINPTDTHDHIITESFIYQLSKLRNVKKLYQLYNFQDELSILKGCYPVWKDIVTYYNFQMLEILNLGIFLNEAIVEKFQNLFIDNLRSMHRLRILGLTLHNDGSSNKRFHLTTSILELPKVIGGLPCLTEFEFNTEIEILLNILTDFFKNLTQLKNIRKFKSEWLQISQNSFRAFAKRLYQMTNLELLDIHLYSLYDIPKKELDSIFLALKDSIEKMNNLKTIQITCDNEYFAQEDVRKIWKTF